MGTIREECGVVGVFGHPEAAWLTYLALHALQHRGQEGTGICTTDGQTLYVHRGRGLVSDIYSKQVLAELPGHSAIGHNRYSTMGSDLTANLQPLVASYRDGRIALAHNGNIVNARELREECEHLGSIFQSTVDSEVVVHLLARAKPPDLEGRLLQALSRVRGAFSLVCLTPERLVGLRDPHGFRPLCLGRYNGAWILASESCALDILNAEFVREVEPGEMVIVSREGLATRRLGPAVPRRECIFELIYFARPDSRVFGRCVNDVRVALGRELAREAPAAADLVLAVPDSSNAASLGYAQESGIPLAHGLIRNHYVGRTFINPSQSLRDFGVRLKYNVVREIVGGKRVVVIDDSVVRGTTSRSLMRMIRAGGAAEVHFRVSSPPVRHPCYYGIDMPTYEELIAAKMESTEEIRAYLGVDSLAYLTAEGMLRAAEAPGTGEACGFCHACFTGDYPVRWKKTPQKNGLEIRI